MQCFSPNVNSRVSKGSLRVFGRGYLVVLEDRSRFLPLQFGNEMVLTQFSGYFRVDNTGAIEQEFEPGSQDKSSV